MGKILESRFQRNLIKDIRNRLVDAIVMKLDTSYKQGVPDLLILYKGKWATLECKRNCTAEHQPNQDWYVNRMDSMSFSRFIFPENRDEVLNDLIFFFTDRKGTETK